MMFLLLNILSSSQGDPENVIIQVHQYVGSNYKSNADEDSNDDSQDNVPTTEDSKSLGRTTESSTTIAPTTKDPTVCSISGINYPDGHETNTAGVPAFYCFKLRCDMGTWVNDGYAGFDACASCFGFTTITTFDWKSIMSLPAKECSFSAFQEGSSSSPAYYLYVKTAYKAGDSSSALEFEFKENGQSAINCTVSDINSCSTGALTETPQEVQPGVFAFKNAGAEQGVLNGPIFTVTFGPGAPFQIFVPVTTKGTGNINGVCANYNGDDSDDLVLRDGTSSSDPTAILESWAVGTC